MLEEDDELAGIFKYTNGMYVSLFSNL